MKLLCLAAAGAFAIAAGGCGGDSSSASEDAPTKAAFIKQADEICHKVDKRQFSGLRSYSEKHPNDGGTPAYEEALVLKVGLPPIETEVEELGELTPPDGQAEEVEEILTAIEEAIVKTKQSPQGAMKPAGENDFRDAEEMARSYGLEVCGEI